MESQVAGNTRCQMLVVQGLPDYFPFKTAGILNEISGISRGPQTLHYTKQCDSKRGCVSALCG